MASDNPFYLSGLRAGGDLSAADYTLVKVHTTTDQVVVCTAASDIPLAVRYPDGDDAAGEACKLVTFQTGRWIKVKTGAAGVTAGWVGTNASGLLVTKTADKDFAIGRCLKAWDSGDYAEVLCMPCFLGV